jgi:hypothetical protein
VFHLRRCVTHEKTHFIIYEFNLLWFLEQVGRIRRPVLLHPVRCALLVRDPGPLAPRRVVCAKHVLLVHGRWQDLNIAISVTLGNIPSRLAPVPRAHV